VLQPAFVCGDMRQIIEESQPDIWIYGHTHECGSHTIGRTRIISNQLGYRGSAGCFECEGLFDEAGCIQELWPGAAG
jgi:hypothetical protein